MLVTSTPTPCNAVGCVQDVGDSDGNTTDVSSVSDASEASSVLDAGDAFTVSHAPSASDASSSIDDSDCEDDEDATPPSRLNRFARLSFDDMSTSDASDGASEQGSDLSDEHDVYEMGSGVYARLQEVC